MQVQRLAASELARGHHAAMPYDEVAAFVADLRGREALAALALELCILTAARSGGRVLMCLALWVALGLRL